MNHIEHKSTMILNGAAKGGINTTDEAVTMSIQGQINHWYLVRTLWIKAGSWWEYILTHSVPKPKRVISAILLSAFPAVVSIMILSFLVIVVNLKGKIPFLYTTWSISGFNFFTAEDWHISWACIQSAMEDRKAKLLQNIFYEQKINPNTVDFKRGLERCYYWSWLQFYNLTVLKQNINVKQCQTMDSRGIPNIIVPPFYMEKRKISITKLYAVFISI